jgi:large subunit ribosomal protein L30
MNKVKVTQIKSTIDRSSRQKETVRALGLRKISDSATHLLTPQVKGMISKVSHLIKIEEI